MHYLQYLYNDYVHYALWQNLILYIIFLNTRKIMFAVWATEVQKMWTGQEEAVEPALAHLHVFNARSIGFWKGQNFEVPTLACSWRPGSNQSFQFFGEIKSATLVRRFPSINVAVTLSCPNQHQAADATSPPKCSPQSSGKLLIVTSGLRMDDFVRRWDE